MEIVTGAISTLLPKLAALLTGEYNLQRNLRSDIRFLTTELESMQAAIERVSEAPVTDKLVKIWARDVRELSYDIEDSIDKFMVHIDNNPPGETDGPKGFIKRSFRLLSTANLRHRIAMDIKAIKELVNEVAERRERYKIDSLYLVRTTPTTVDPRLVGNYEETKNLVGISGPQNELVELLMESEATMDNCLKVISIVGAGGLGKTTVANAVYHQVRGEFECHAFVSVSHNPDLNRILSSILRQFSGESYGNTETWPAEEIIDKIRLFLADKRYIIILDDIWDKLAWAHIRCALVENKRSSKIITTTRIHDVAVSCCAEVDGAIYKLKHLSHDDSKKLFYKRIFGSDKDDCHSELKEMSEKILRKCGGVPLAINTIASLLANNPRNIHQWHDVHNSIGSGLEKSQSVETMRNILSISYYGLPSHLKACLLYLSTYPEDYNILRDQLIRRWISEGFIQGENFVTVLLDQQSTYLPKKIRRLSLQSSADGHPVLNAENYSHLRCLILKDTNIANLPKETGKLGCLQTLDLRNTSISELPSTIVQLRQLLQLYIDRSVMLPVGCGGVVISRLPRWIKSSFLFLGSLDIKIGKLQQVDFQNLGALSYLYDLYITVLEIVSERLVVGIDHREFQSLVKFSFSSDAMKLIFAQQAMPRLKYLELAFRIQETKDFDIGLENLSSLKHARIRIDCWGSKVNEVELVDAAMWNAACANPNHPRLEVIRHFENTMIRDDEKLQVQDETEKTEEEDVVDGWVNRNDDMQGRGKGQQCPREPDVVKLEMIVEKMGPWGGNSGGSWDIKVAPQRLESVTICSGTIIDALAFSYWDRNGRRHATEFWGGTGGSAHTIHLGTSEFLLEVSGTVGPFFSITDAITSLKFVTNLRSYGPFGVRKGSPFCTQVKKDNSIVGFFGRSGVYLQVIGVYICPI
ncbi:hypothetical protein EJB05_27878 [Eragrostis curvula]|uniref:Jacalin-type lectin domain-containing protein n=1 Tax=Eragrostis curvula TaxID=38414 RepID=A0A5J9UPT1_9POAL|nr:hypothetical protein EJB05_27878 [Eragrostis curvula]